MLFNSGAFVVLAVTTFVFYYLPIARKWQLSILIISSLTFYAYNQPDLLTLLLLSVSLNIVASYLVVYGSPSRQKFHATWGVVGNLLILLFFKYSPLIGGTFFGSYNPVGSFLMSIPLPIGISFFTFQGISLVIDTYTARDKSEFRSYIARNLYQHAERVLFFKAFFPQLVSGPIVKAHYFLPQIQPKYLKDIRWEYCFRTLVMGYFLKMVIADNLKDHTAYIAYPFFESFSSLTLVALLFGYSMQIFADFAGYSLIALGFAGLFGYQFPTNFNYPYIAASFSDFWRRWHISLSSFLREYLYIPLGGNRKGPLRTYANLMITMVLGGLWHGAAWSYAIWGLAHGLALALERLLSDKVRSPLLRLHPVLKGTMVFCFVSLAWLLFKLPEFNQALAYLRAIATNTHRPHDGLIISFIMIYSTPVVLYHFRALVRERVASYDQPRWDYALYGFLLFLIITNSGSSDSFIYFQF
ncbi:MBOAT family O-acyltransferase [Tellurirhabdus bombi]|uniref:MBOAT family O-acyltransferase n=1 Tax=Tellurirhabdus bombi TaxID=2907205 RepID=UPI001F197024|nr:MBOAT family O-acyltransferase [Tellurirhabdus bombi]